MALKFPCAATSFGDAAWTRDLPLFRKYILAQFHSTSDFTWIRETRQLLGVRELKWSTLRSNELLLRDDPGRWTSIQDGINQASLIVIDTGRIHSRIFGRMLRDGADLMEYERPEGLKLLSDISADAIIRGTPIAHLSTSLSLAMPRTALPQSFVERFTPSQIRDAVGPNLQHARVFAARAHAMFDVKETDNGELGTCDVFRSPSPSPIFTEIVHTRRSFDVEAPRTLPVLNDAAATIASCVSLGGPVYPRSDQPFVYETDSVESDGLQAADIAAGYAREALTFSSDDSGVMNFRRIWINGRRIG